MTTTKRAASDFVSFRNEQVVANDIVTRDVTGLKKDVGIINSFIDNFKGKYTILAIAGMILVAAVTAVISNYAVKSFQVKTTTTTTNVICLQDQKVINCPTP